MPISKYLIYVLFVKIAIFSDFEKVDAANYFPDSVAALSDKINSPKVAYESRTKFFFS